MHGQHVYGFSIELEMGKLKLSRLVVFTVLTILTDLTRPPLAWIVLVDVC